MKTVRFLAIATFFTASLSACRPDPIDIEVAQGIPEMTISSFTPDLRTLYVSAGYSVSSMRRLIDTSTYSDYKALPQDLLIDSALVLLRADGGGTDTLQWLGQGLYGRRDLDLQPHTGYTLIVDDLKKGRRITARTSFMPQPVVDTMYVARSIKGGDTLSRLHLRVPQVAPGERILVCYNTSAAMRLQQRPLQRDLSALYDFQPRRLEILRVPEDTRGLFETDLTLQVEPRDTVLVRISKVDGSFSDYLSAYKRSGSFFSQLSGEPVNLPGNIQRGFGYFAMYLSRSGVYDLAQL